jgi:hypothetical protein
MQIGSIQSSIPPPPIQAAKAPKASPLGYIDPADANQDGVVSPAERLAYELTHPSAAAAANGASAYTPQGAAGTPSHGGLLDLRG